MNDKYNNPFSIRNKLEDNIRYRNNLELEIGNLFQRRTFSFNLKSIRKVNKNMKNVIKKYKRVSVVIIKQMEERGLFAMTGGYDETGYARVR